MRSLRSVSIAVLMMLLPTGVALAQATAQLDGIVRDESGGVLPGVTITVTQTDTGFTRTVTIETNGSYVLPNLPIGPYKLEVSLQGFRTYSQTGIVLQVGGMPTINVVLFASRRSTSSTTSTGAIRTRASTRGLSARSTRRTAIRVSCSSPSSTASNERGFR